MASETSKRRMFTLVNIALSVGMALYLCANELWLPPESQRSGRTDEASPSSPLAGAPALPIVAPPALVDVESEALAIINAVRGNNKLKPLVADDLQSAEARRLAAAAMAAPADTPSSARELMLKAHAGMIFDLEESELRLFDLAEISGSAKPTQELAGRWLNRFRSNGLSRPEAESIGLGVVQDGDRWSAVVLLMQPVLSFDQPFPAAGGRLNGHVNSRYSDAIIEMVVERQGKGWFTRVETERTVTRVSTDGEGRFSLDIPSDTGLWTRVGFLVDGRPVGYGRILPVPEAAKIRGAK